MMMMMIMIYKENEKWTKSERAESTDRILYIRSEREVNEREYRDRILYIIRVEKNKNLII